MITKLTSLIQRLWKLSREWRLYRTYQSTVAWAGPNALSYEENLGISTRLVARWNVGSRLWNPLHDKTVPTDAFVVGAGAFHQEVGSVVVRHILANQGINRVFELDELGGGYAYGLERVLSFENPFDLYWTSDRANWLIHVSHEETVAFAGEWLVGAIQKVWPDWKEHLWM